MDCDCTESCAMADQFTPATRELMVFTKSAKRYFDLDAVREPFKPATLERAKPGAAPHTINSSDGTKDNDTPMGVVMPAVMTQSGAPPLDWWKIDPDIPYTPQHEGEQMPATFYVGDAIEVMGKLPEHSVDLILTSPPFLALRSYLPADHPDKGKEGGSQSTPGEFIDWLLDVAEACNRVLAPHGSLCVELGDTYTGSGQGRNWGLSEAWVDKYGSKWASDDDLPKPQVDWKDGAWPLAKSLSLIPESFRFAMVYGFNPHTGRTTEPWRLRNVIRWVRPNPPVGALGDKFRPATSELMVFCKSAKRYFDLDAVREPLKDSPGNRYVRKVSTLDGERRPDGSQALSTDNRITADYDPSKSAGAPPLDWWNIPLLEGEEETRYGPKGRQTTEEHGDPKRQAERDAGVGGNGWLVDRTFHQRGGAPPLDWWEIPPGGYEGAHYAVFPPELCVKPVKAMCPEKVCRVCEEPSRRIAEYDYVKSQETNNVTARGLTKGVLGSGSDGTFTHGRAHKLVETVGFTDCGHDDWRPGLVLDPFAGSGTTLAVATGHGRDAIGIDLDSRNFDLALARVGPFILTRGDIDEREP